MADTVKKMKAAATPKQRSAKNVKVAEVATPTTPVRKGLELVAKVEVPKKAQITAAQPTKTPTKKENVVVISHLKVVSREMIELVAYQIWVQRGYQHGYALEDWITAEKKLLERAS